MRRARIIEQRGPQNHEGIRPLPSSGGKGALEIVGGRIAQRQRVHLHAYHLCRFCRRTFSGLHFHAHFGACHGCSEAHLRIASPSFLENYR